MPINFLIFGGGGGYFVFLGEGGVEVQLYFLTLRTLQDFVGDSLFLSFCWELWWEFCGFFRTHQNKGPKHFGKFRSIFCKFRSQLRSADSQP